MDYLKEGNVVVSITETTTVVVQYVNKLLADYSFIRHSSGRSSGCNTRCEAGTHPGWGKFNKLA